MTMLNLDTTKRYTYADYLTWMDDMRRELYDGFVKMMTPAPSRGHQKISVQLLRHLVLYLDRKKCEVYHAPSDVRLPKNKNNSDETIFTVLQPDLYVVCDLSKLDDRGCLGAPDLVIEITSPKTARRDLKDKYQIYEQHGVREYWIVNPSDENVLTFVLDANGKFQLAGLYAGDDKIPVHIFDGDLQIDLTEVFENKTED
ncbi:MAG: Uma2 family endonuclease [Bacteroidales bacterium]|nr:Uma2 family endonuclease [Bacteroidales bacterium]